MVSVNALQYVIFLQNTFRAQQGKIQMYVQPDTVLHSELGLGYLVMFLLAR